MNSDHFSKIASRAAGPIGLIGTIGGFISDVLQPLGEIAPTVTGISLLAAIVFGAMTYRESRNKRHDIWDTAYSGGLFVSICSVVIFAIWSFVFAAGPERGYLAENVEPIAQLQAQLLSIEEDVADIKETTEQTQEDVQVIATVQSDTQSDVETVATAQAQGFADIQAAFAQLQLSQTIIENPTTPQEFYSNARLQQIKGNTAEAIKAYEGYLEYNLDYVDPIQDYADLLKATDGITRARETITQRLTETPNNLSLDLVAAGMLDERPQRIARYESLMTRAPTYGPAFLAAGTEYDQQYSEEGSRSIVEKMITALTTLQTLETEQNFSRYYIDKNRAITAYDTSLARLETRRNALANSPSALGPQVFLNFEEEGLLVFFIVTDTISDFKMSFDDPNNLRSTGSTPTAIGPIPKLGDFPPFALPLGSHVLYYQYTDASGVESAVFEKPFTMNPIGIDIQPPVADFTTGKYSALVDAVVYEGNKDAYWTFYWGLSEDQMDNKIDATYQAVFTIADLDPGEYTLYMRAEADDGSAIDTIAVPFVVE